MERPASISFKLNGPKKKIKSVLFVGDSHVAKMEKEAPGVCKFGFVGIGGAQTHDWKLNIGNVIQRLKSEVVVIQMGGNDVSQHPKKFVCDKLPIGQTAQHLCALMRFCRQEGKEAYVVKVVSRQNCSSRAEAISMLNKRLKDQRKHYFVTHDQVHLTKAGYAELFSVVDNFIGDMYYFWCFVLLCL